MAAIYAFGDWALPATSDFLFDEEVAAAAARLGEEADAAPARLAEEAAAAAAPTRLATALPLGALDAALVAFLGLTPALAAAAVAFLEGETYVLAAFGAVCLG